MKLFLRFFFLMCSLTCFAQPKQAVTMDAVIKNRPVPPRLVNDYAGILTVEQRDALRPHLPPLEDLPWLRWKGRLKFPYRELVLHGRGAVADFDSLTRREFRVVRVVEP
jgi:hypothetical protein